MSSLDDTDHTHIFATLSTFSEEPENVLGPPVFLSVGGFAFAFSCENVRAPVTPLSDIATHALFVLAPVCTVCL